MTTPLARNAGNAGQRRALRRDTALVAIGQLAAVLSAVLVSVVGARTLPTAEFGALAWALSWVTFLAVVAQFGLPQVATIGFTRQAPRTHRTLLRRLLLAQAIGVLVTAVIWQGLVGPATAAAGTPSATYEPLVLLVTLWLPVAAAGPLLVTVLRARDRFGLALGYGEHVRRLVLVTVLLIAAADSVTAPSAEAALAWTIAVETAVYLVCGLLLVAQVARDGSGRHATARQGRADPDAGVSGATGDSDGSTWRLLRSGSTFSLAVLGSVTVLQAGIWLLALVAPVEQVAILSVAVRIAVLVSVPTLIGARTLAPRIAAAAGSGGLAALQEPVRRFAVWSTAATALAVLVLAATGRLLLPAVFGPAYAGALVPALVLCAGALVNAWTGPCSVLLSHAGHQRTVAIAAVVSTVAFAGLAAWWGSAWGATGVAAAAAVATSARNLPLARAAHRKLGIRTSATPSPKEKE